MKLKRAEKLFLRVRPNNSQELDIWKDSIRTFANDPVTGLYKLRGLVYLQEFVNAELNKAMFSIHTLGRQRETPKKVLEWGELVKETAKKHNLKRICHASKIAKIEWEKRKMLAKSNDKIQSEKDNSTS